MNGWKRIFKESAPLLAVTAFIGILGGQMLNSIEAILLEVPVLLFLLPVLNGVGGNIGTVLGARISSGLHSGYISPDLSDIEMRENIFLTLIMGGLTYMSVALIVASSSLALSLGIYALDLLFIILGTGFIITFGMMILTVTVSIWSHRKRLDPDNIVVPIVTTSGDFIGITSVLLMVWVVIL